MSLLNDLINISIIDKSSNPIYMYSMCVKAALDKVIAIVALEQWSTQWTPLNRDNSFPPDIWNL